MRKFNTDKYLKSTVIRRYWKIAAFAVLGMIVGASLVLLISGNSEEWTSDTDETIIEESVVEVYSLPESEPVRLRIPTIGVDALFEAPLGVDSDNEIQVPEAYDTVGWYKYGPTPGEIGPAVVLGHVDSYEGPAVLFSLGQLDIGDTIEIEREDGTTAVFVVEKMKRHPQSGFPTADVYSDLDYPGLRIITCTGVYDRGVQRYTHNLIVFAKLVKLK